MTKLISFVVVIFLNTFCPCSSVGSLPFTCDPLCVYNLTTFNSPQGHVDTLETCDCETESHSHWIGVVDSDYYYADDSVDSPVSVDAAYARSTNTGIFDCTYIAQLSDTVDNYDDYDVGEVVIQFFELNSVADDDDNNNYDDWVDDYMYIINFDNRAYTHQSDHPLNETVYVRTRYDFSENANLQYDLEFTFSEHISDNAIH
jgi:hypothetical protein